MKAIKKTAQISMATVLAWLVAGVASAQVSTTTPGVPNTGAGGDLLTNVLLLSVTAAIALFGVAYLGRKWVQQS